MSWANPDSDLMGDLIQAANQIANACSIPTEEALAAIQRSVFNPFIPPEVIRMIEIRCGELTLRG